MCLIGPARAAPSASPRSRMTRPVGRAIEDVQARVSEPAHHWETANHHDRDG